MVYELFHRMQIHGERRAARQQLFIDEEVVIRTSSVYFASDRFTAISSFLRRFRRQTSSKRIRRGSPLPCHRSRQSDGGSRQTRGKMSAKVAESASSRASIRDPVERLFARVPLAQLPFDTLSFSLSFSLFLVIVFSHFHPSAFTSHASSLLSSNTLYNIFMQFDHRTCHYLWHVDSREKFEKS